jgi:nucleosome binding factor SPN SPT16 subunit
LIFESQLKIPQNKVGIFANEPQSGAFADEWNAIWALYKKEVEEVNITAAISAGALSVKDENELVSISACIRIAILIPS